MLIQEFVLTENEDCLFLNVFVPSTTKRSKPHDMKVVMVWIQGFSPVVQQGRDRAFTLGSSTEYPGHVLASFNDVIVVTLNYRLGILGFFNEPDTDIKGNYGMYDQVNIGFVAVVYHFKSFSHKIIIPELLF